MIELRDVLTMASILVSVLAAILISRNARRATAVNAENVDLARIRDLRVELKETREELDKVKTQATQLAQHLTAANERAITSARREAEMLNYARMPGMDLTTWLRRFDPDGTHELGAGVGR